MWLTRLSITRPITILMLVLTLVILGMQSRGRLPVDLYPDVEFPMLFISTVYPGTGPEEMETLVSKPIEDQLSTISGLKKISSTSSEGLSQVQMEFELGTELDEVTADVRSKLDVLRNRLPEDAQAPVVIKADIGALPVIQLNLASSRRSSIEVRRIADDVLKDRLSQVSGVASVTVSGGDVRELRVEVDKNRLEAYGLGITQVVNAISAENLNLPSGTIEEAQRNYSVRVMGEFTDPAQILDVRIPNAQGNPNLTVRDVAAVRDTVADASIYTRVNGGPSVSLTIQKQSDANTVDVVDRVRKELEKLSGKPFTEEHVKTAEAMEKKGQQYHLPSSTAPILSDDITITATWDQSTFIKDSLRDVYESLIIGALLAVLIVFLFLHSLRGTFIIALAIPTSMIATFLVMDMLGFSINMMSMLGLSLCVGILVDDSIVVLENIHRHLKMGKSPQEAAIAGRSEIGQAAMAITLVDVVVFVPIAFMGGIVGQMFRQFGLTIAAATLFSLFISFTLTPMLASRWLKKHEEEEADEARQQEHPGLFKRFTDTWERGYSAVERTYRRVLTWSLDHHAAVICLGLMTFIASIASTMPKTSPSLFVCILVMGILMLLGTVLSGVGARKTVRKNLAFKPLATIFALLTAVTLLVPTSFTFEFAPSVDQRQLTINIEHEVGTSLDVTDATTRQIEKALQDKKRFPEVKTISSSVGGGSSFFSGSSSGADTASVNVELYDMAKGFRSTDEFVTLLNTEFANMPGVKITAAASSQGGPGGATPVNIEVSGPDMARTQEVANQIAAIIRKTEGSYNTELSWRSGRPEVQARIDRDRAAQYGLSVYQIAQALRTGMEGDTSAKFREDGKEYDIRVVLPEEQRGSVTQVPNMVVGTSSSGRPVYLYEVVHLDPAGGPTKVERKNRQRAVSVTSDLRKGYAIGNFQSKIKPEIDALDTTGVTVYWAGEAEDMAESGQNMVSALLLSCVLVFILMAALFESVLSPLIVWLSVPQAMAGAIFALTFAHKSLSIISMIGIIMLVGLVTKNAILLVDYTNTLRKEHGLKRREALLQAGPTRLRPILMTTMAMVFGMMPTAIAFSKGSEMRQPMALTVIGGLILSMFLTLLMVPTFYEIIDNIGEKFANLKTRVISGSKVEQPSSTL